MFIHRLVHVCVCYIVVERNGGYVIIIILTVIILIVVGVIVMRKSIMCFEESYVPVIVTAIAS